MTSTIPDETQVQARSFSAPKRRRRSVETSAPPSKYPRMQPPPPPETTAPRRIIKSPHAQGSTNANNPFVPIRVRPPTNRTQTRINPFVAPAAGDKANAAPRGSAAASAQRTGTQTGRIQVVAGTQPSSSTHATSTVDATANHPVAGTSATISGKKKLSGAPGPIGADVEANHAVALANVALQKRDIADMVAAISRFENAQNICLCCFAAGRDHRGHNMWTCQWAASAMCHYESFLTDLKGDGWPSFTCHCCHIPDASIVHDLVYSIC